MEAILSRTQWVNTVECMSLPGMDWVNIDILHLNPLNSHKIEIKQIAGY